MEVCTSPVLESYPHRLASEAIGPTSEFMALRTYHDGLVGGNEYEDVVFPVYGRAGCCTKPR